MNLLKQWLVNSTLNRLESRDALNEWTVEFFVFIYGHISSTNTLNTVLLTTE